jgi:hypothetical protein
MKILFGYGGGRIRSIKSVVRGKACECSCLVCGGSLVARQGKQKRWHFAHASGELTGECGESAAHKAAKHLLILDSRVLLPDGQLVALHDPVEEAAGLGYRADLLARTSTGWLQIEVAFTHKVGAAKMKRLRRASIPTLEIILELGDDPSADEVLEQATHLGNRRWLVPPLKRHACDRGRLITDHISARWLASLPLASREKRDRARALVGEYQASVARSTPATLPAALEALTGCDVLVPLMHGLYGTVAGVTGIWLDRLCQVGLGESVLMAQGLQMESRGTLHKEAA